MKHLHFIGIGGIGMSGLASWCRSLNIRVSGSDRDAEKKENAHIFGPLINQGIEIFPQDGSFIKNGTPDALVYSSAIEENNPDFMAGSGIKRLHRSQLLSELLNAPEQQYLTVAVAGSCGKSTVTAYLAEAVANSGKNAGFLNGAISKHFVSPDSIGNFHSCTGGYFVFEADESDKSLINYTPDYAVILNMGTDHYSKEELAEVFGTFLNRIRIGAVIERQVFEAVRPYLNNPDLKLKVFDTVKQADSEYFISEYAIFTDDSGQHIPGTIFNDRHKVQLPAPGFHTAANALAIFAMLELIGIPEAEALHAIESFEGIRRRNDRAGITEKNVPVYDDYAHNPEKIASCLKTLMEITEKRIFAVFQPHGFGPLGFFRDELFEILEKILRDDDRFFMLPPFYAGGTSSFKPTSQEVISDWKKRSRDPELYTFADDRKQLRDHLLAYTAPGDMIVIMGARDNSLSVYASSFCSTDRQ